MTTPAEPSVRLHSDDPGEIIYAVDGGPGIASGAAHESSSRPAITGLGASADFGESG